MNVAYLDLFHGVSGEMLLGALASLGVNLAELRETLRPLGILGLDLQTRVVRKAGIASTHVSLTVENSFCTLDQARERVCAAELPIPIPEQANQALQRLAEAKSIAYDKTLSEIRFTNRMVVEIAAVLVGFNRLGVERVCVSEIRVGAGDAQDGEGFVAPPGPVVSHLLIGFRVTAGPVAASLVTPAGATLVRVFADISEPMPSMELTGIGVGAGDLEIEGFPHILRIFTGRTTSGIRDEVVVIESQIDDMNPEVYSVLMEDAFRAGALDVTLTPVYMKKNRPGVLITVLSPVGREEEIIRLLLSESATLGVRLRRTERRILQRESTAVQTPWGVVHGKVVWGPGVGRRFKAEYEACRRIHRETGVPFMEIAAVAQRAFEDSSADSEGNGCQS